jgi:uncharacterized protein (DUF58 family)
MPATIPETPASPSARPHSKYLNLAALSALAHLRFATRHRIEGSYSGRHRSRQRGGSAEFVDYREYAPGEDLRRIDWKVLGRTGRPYIRLYQDETNLLCTMLVDASRSMQYAGHGQKPDESKLRYVQRLATAMSHIIGSQRDQVGLAIAAGGLVELLPPAAAPLHLWRVQRTLETLDEQKLAPQTDLASALRSTFDRLTRRGVLVVMSDFLVDDLEAVFANVRLFRHRRWEVVIMHLVHPEEERLPTGMAYRFEGMENDGAIDCTPADVARGYEQAFEAHAATVRALALAAGCDHQRVLTSTPYLQTLGGFLVERSA